MPLEVHVNKQGFIARKKYFFLRKQDTKTLDSSTMHSVKLMHICLLVPWFSSVSSLFETKCLSCTSEVLFFTVLFLSYPVAKTLCQLYSSAEQVRAEAAPAVHLVRADHHDVEHDVCLHLDRIQSTGTIGYFF